MRPMLCVTPNPAIDKTAIIPGFRLGAIHRPQRLIALAGGKGLNVAHVIKRLGGDVRLCLLLAGHSGAWIAEELSHEGIPADIVWSQGETRTCVSVFDPETHVVTEIYETGTAITPTEWACFETLVGKALTHVALATFSGSLPPGGPTDGYARLVKLAHQESVPSVLDTHGEPLQAALAIRPHIVKVNAREAGEIIGQDGIRTPQDAASAALELREKGVELAIITLGGAGAVAANEREVWLATPPSIPVLSPVGSGDAFLGGLVLALQNRETMAEALRFGIAVGAANALALGAGTFERRAVTDLLPKVKIEQFRAS
jgi:tagatose 6-phosphate kinase